MTGSAMAWRTRSGTGDGPGMRRRYVEGRGGSLLMRGGSGWVRRGFRVRTIAAGRRRSQRQSNSAGLRRTLSGGGGSGREIGESGPGSLRDEVGVSPAEPALAAPFQNRAVRQCREAVAVDDVEAGHRQLLAGGQGDCRL